MNDLTKILKIENIGYVANNNPFRAVLDGNEFRGLIPAPEWYEEIVRRDATVDDTVAEMKKLIKSCAWQTKGLAERLKGSNIYDTCGKVWNFLFTHIKYKEDDKGKEQLRTPALSWEVRRTRGIDCDDFSIFCSTILLNLGIPHYLRIARYPKKDYFQHVYVVVPKQNKSYITVDAVLDEFDAEKEPIETKDFLVMDNSKLNGIDISVLGSIGDDVFDELSGILNGDDFGGLDGIGGQDEISEEEGLNAIYNHLNRTRDFIRKHPRFIQQVEHPNSFLGMLDYAIGYWNTDKRDEALGILEEQEENMNIINGLGDMPDGYEDVGLFYGLDGMNGVALLGKAKSKKGFFKKVRDVVQKAKSKSGRRELLRKAAKKFIRFDPAVTTVRVGIIAALKTNFAKIASRLKIGYYTEEEARNHHLDMEQWRKARQVLKDAEGLFVNKFQGKPENFRRAILRGRAGGLNSIDDIDDSMDGLGVYVAAATTGGAATAAAAATPWIKKVLDLMKKVDWGKLIGAAKKSGLFNRKKKKAEKEMEQDETASARETNSGDENNSNTKENENTAEEKSTSIPKEDSKDNGGGSQSNPEQAGEKTEPETMDKPETKTEESGSQNTENTESGDKSNLPATTETNTAAETGRSAMKTVTEGEGFFDKAKTWVKDNPGTSVAIVGGTVIGIWGLSHLLKAKPKQSLSGAKRGRKKKGKNKSHPPKALQGTKRKRGGGGSPKQINL
ncbi:MAG TPA: transglutaminase-like domain-containing protein [Bacteroidia bacterium]|jgi:hypothetical protein|nr:transglutaminase-like domain-containing protein [Bacteroidia bacterium]